MILPPLYHWSPRERREAILAEGLQPYKQSISLPTHGFHYICLGTSPAGAWRLSGDMSWASEIEEWDLWEVRLGEHDEMHVNAEFGDRIKEVRIRNVIPPDRVWYVATRETPYARELQSS